MPSRFVLSVQQRLGTSRDRALRDLNIYKLLFIKPTAVDTLISCYISSKYGSHQLFSRQKSHGWERCPGQRVQLRNISEGFFPGRCVGQRAELQIHNFGGRLFLFDSSKSTLLKGLHSDLLVKQSLKIKVYVHVTQTPCFVNFYLRLSAAGDLSIQRRASLSTILGRSHFVKLSNNPWNSVKGNPSLLYICFGIVTTNIVIISLTSLKTIQFEQNYHHICHLLTLPIIIIIIFRTSTTVIFIMSRVKQFKILWAIFKEETLDLVSMQSLNSCFFVFCTTQKKLQHGWKKGLSNEDKPISSSLYQRTFYLTLGNLLNICCQSS